MSKSESKIEAKPPMRDAEDEWWPDDEPQRPDYRAHVETYRGFVRGVQITITIAAATLILLAIFLL